MPKKMSIDDSGDEQDQFLLFLPLFLPEDVFEAILCKKTIIKNRSSHDRR